MRAKKYILSMAMVYMAYFTHGIQAIILSQNKVNFFTQWGYTDEVAGAAAVSLAITATGFGKFLTVWLGGEISDKIEFQLPGGDMGRTLVVIDKIKKTPKKYPRKAGTPAKMPIV